MTDLGRETGWYRDLQAGAGEAERLTPTLRQILVEVTLSHAEGLAGDIRVDADRKRAQALKLVQVRETELREQQAAVEAEASATLSVIRTRAVIRFFIYLALAIPLVFATALLASIGSFIITNLQAMVQERAGSAPSTWLFMGTSIGLANVVLLVVGLALGPPRLSKTLSALKVALLFSAGLFAMLVVNEGYTITLWLIGPISVTLIYLLISLRGGAIRAMRRGEFTNPEGYRRWANE